jgi:cobaltochelatase CobS
MTDAIDDILSVLSERRDEITAKSEPKPPPATVIKLESTLWEEREDGKSMRYVPASELFGWSFAVDHLVPCFKGYDAPSVPSIYIPPVEDLEKLSLAISLKLKVNVVGPTGAGKTLMYEYYAAMTGRPYLRIEHNVELDKASVFGQTHLSTDDAGNTITDFIPGVFVTSADEPTLVNLDELSRASGHANMIYQRPLDRNQIFLPEMKDAGKMAITPDEFWIMCASDNTKGNGDDMDMYSASNVQDAAFINRWDIVIEQDYLTVAQEGRLFAMLCPDAESKDSSALIKFSNLIHKGFKKGEISTAFSPRNLVAIAKLVTAGVTMRESVEMNYISRVSKSELPDVSECLRSAFGS